MTKEQIRDYLDKTAPDVISFQLTIREFRQSERAFPPKPEEPRQESYTESYLPDQLSSRFKSAKYNRDFLQLEKPIYFVISACRSKNLRYEKLMELNQDNQSPSDDRVLMKITCEVQVAKKESS